MKILVVDDDHELADMLRYILTRDGHEVSTAWDGEAALRMFTATSLDLIVLDLGMPKRNGLEVLTEIRRTSQVPIIILTSSQGEDNLVHALDSGADDYLTKPFRPRELKARVRVMLRRSQSHGQLGGGSRDSLLMGGLNLNARTMEVSVGGQNVRLSRTEFGLLQYLMVNCDKVLSTSEILANVWGFDAEQNEDLVRVTISRLRRKIEPDPSAPCYIVNVPGMGYRFLYKLREK